MSGKFYILENCDMTEADLARQQELAASMGPMRMELGPCCYHAAGLQRIMEEPAHEGKAGAPDPNHEGEGSD